MSAFTGQTLRRGLPTDLVTPDKHAKGRVQDGFYPDRRSELQPVRYIDLSESLNTWVGVRISGQARIPLMLDLWLVYPAELAPSTSLHAKASLGARALRP